MLAHRVSKGNDLEASRNFHFTLNGQPAQINAPADMPILWALRDYLGKTEVKFGCGIAQCGACTIHINGQAVRSCVTPISEASGQNVATVQDSSPVLDRVKQAWEKEQVPQCGYCQPGQIMTACALLQKNPRPTDKDIKKTMSGNLCRCGTYPRIMKAMQSLAGRR